MLGLGSSIGKHPVTGKSIVRDGLVLQHNYNLSSVEPLSSGAAYFVESNTDYISVSDAASLSFDACSFSAWIYVSDATNFPIIGKGTYNNTAEYQLKVQSDDKIHFWVADESVASCHIGRSSPTITSYENQWIHVAGTYDGGTAASGLKIYINGVQSDDTDIGANTSSFVAMENLGANVEIGKYGSIYGDGYMCNVGIWSSALSQAQVKSIMNKNYDSLSASEKEDLVSWWNLDSVIPDTTTLVYDNHHGGGEILGGDLSTNGDFATDTDWSKGGGWSIGGGVATHNGSTNANIAQSIPLTVGTAYSVTYTVINASVGSQIGISTNSSSIQIVRTTDGTYTETFTAALTSFYIRSLWNNGNPVSVDNVSVKLVNGNTGTLS